VLQGSILFENYVDLNIATHIADIIIISNDIITMTINNLLLC